MIYKYSFFNSLGCYNFSNKCVILNIFSYFKKGCGYIFYKTYLNKEILKSIKFFIFYFNINFSFYNFYLNIYPKNILKFNNCLDLSLFFSIFFSFFKLNFKIKVLILGYVNLKTGKILGFKKTLLKLNFLLNKNFNLFIISDSNSFLLKNKFFLKFNYLLEVYDFFKRCLTQRKSSAITKHLSGVQFS